LKEILLKKIKARHYGLSCVKPDMQESEANFLIDKQIKLLNVVVYVCECEVEWAWVAGESAPEPRRIT
jgi:hypothetical protein